MREEAGRRGEENPYAGLVDEIASALARSAEGFRPGLRPREIGRVEYIGKGIATVKGLPGARSEELLAFPGGTSGGGVG